MSHCLIEQGDYRRIARQVNVDARDCQSDRREIQWANHWMDWRLETSNLGRTALVPIGSELVSMRLANLASKSYQVRGVVQIHEAKPVITRQDVVYFGHVFYCLGSTALSAVRKHISNK